MAHFDLDLSEVERVFLDTWLAVRGKESFPSWQAFRPESAPVILDDLILLKRDAIDNLRLLYLGRNAVTRLGQDITGENYLSLTSPSMAEMVKTLATTLQENRCGLFLRSQVRAAADSDNIFPLRYLALPFDDEAQNPTSFGLIESVEAEENWDFDNTKIGFLRIDEVRFLDLGFGKPEDMYDISLV